MTEFDGAPDGPGTGGAQVIELEQLADLQAGLLTAPEERALRERIEREPAVAQMWHALETTRNQLRRLQQRPVPDDVAARLEAAIAAETTGGDQPARTGRQRRVEDPATTPAEAADGGAAAPDGARSETGDGAPEGVVDFAAQRGRRARGRRFNPFVLAAAAAAAIAAVVIAVQVRAPDPARPTPGSAPAAPVLSTAELAGQWPSIRDQRELGFLAPAGKLDRCLGGILPPGVHADLLGARPVIVDGGYGELVAVPDPNDSTRVRLVVLGPGCAVEQDHDVIASVAVPR